MHQVIFYFLPPASISDDLRILSSHPPHLKGPNGTILPFAFIPFCAFATDMSVTGEKLDILSYPVCNKFKPSILDGDLCYTLDTSALVEKAQTGFGKDNGIMIILD